MPTRDRLLAAAATGAIVLAVVSLVSVIPGLAGGQTEARRRTRVIPPVAQPAEAAEARAARPTPVYELFVSPGVACQQEIVKRIGEAKEAIYVRAYGFTDRAIGAALIAAHKRGVAVEIVADRSDRTATNSQSDECAAAGITVLYDDKHPISHAKVIVIDRRRCLLGSYNFTEQAKKNAEVMLSIDLAPLAAELIADQRLHAEHSAH